MQHSAAKEYSMTSKQLQQCTALTKLVEKFFIFANDETREKFISDIETHFKLTRDEKEILIKFIDDCIEMAKGEF